MQKFYDDSKYNVAFYRCVDIMVRMMQKYGPQLLDQMQETTNKDCVLSSPTSKASQELEKVA